MHRLRLLFFGFVVFCLGLVTVALGGFRALALTFGLDSIALDQVGVLASIAAGLFFLVASLLPDWSSTGR
jgi:hypothetical protein